MKKALDIIRTVFVWVVVAATVGMMIFTIISVNTFDRNDRSLFGYKAFIVLSDSMKATDFDAGDLVLVKETDPTTLKEGDIISYISQNSHNYGQTVTHKIRRLTTAPDGSPGFITYGTTTNTDDEAVVTYPYIVGQYKFAIPKVGTFFQFLKTTPGYICCIFIPFLLLILYQGLNTVKIFRLYRAEQLAEIQAEKDQIEEERRQSAEMMKELMALKAQLAGGTPPATAPPAEASAETSPESAEPAAKAVSDEDLEEGLERIPVPAETEDAPEEEDETPAEAVSAQ